MKRKFYQWSRVLICSLVLLLTVKANGQTCEWRLAKVVHNSTDPDGPDPAVGSVQFTLQIRTVAGTIPNVTQISTGYSWQSANAMVPLTPGCATANSPANIVMSTAFATAGFVYTTVNQCSPTSQTVGGRLYDRTAAGTLDIGMITLTTAWTDVFTVTLWTLNPSAATGAGFVIINSTAGGTPGPLPVYLISDEFATGYEANSLTYGSALVLPVLFTQYDVTCGDKGAVITWTTATEINSSHFDIEKNSGAGWVTIGTVAGAGNSNSIKKYQYLDLEAGTALYRVKQVDLDGRTEYTAQRSKSCTGRLVNVVLYPVPTSNILNVAIRTDKSIRTELQVYDMAGRIVKTQAALLNNGSNNLTINVAGLAVGEYILRSTDGTLQLNKKFTIAR
jgi:hypothetical protein